MDRLLFRIFAEKLKSMDISNLHQIVYTIGRITPNGINLLGTGFLLNKQGTFVTAAHVTNNDDNNLVVALNPNTNINTYQDTSDTRVSYINVKIEKIDPIRDICILKSDRDIHSNIRIGSTDNINVSEHLGIIGYPHCTQGRNVLTYQDTTVGAKILIEASFIRSKHIVLNIQTRPGQSGSPVFKESDSMLVAMIIGSYAPNSSGSISLGGVDPHTLHQTTHAVSAEYILQMLQ